MYEFPCRPRARAVPVSDGVQQAGDRRPLTRCISTQAVGLQRLGCGVRTWLLVPRLVTSFGMVAGFVFVYCAGTAVGRELRFKLERRKKWDKDFAWLSSLANGTAERLQRKFLP